MPQVTLCSLRIQLIAHRLEVKRERPDYFNAPVPAFGDSARGWLFDALHRHGFSDLPESGSGGYVPVLRDCRVTNAVRCLPPGNLPKPDEVRRCNEHLRRDIEALPALKSVVALGRVAHRAALVALNEPASSRRFAHGAEHALTSGRYLINSYHCSRLNVNTRRLTHAMFDAVFVRIDALLGRKSVSDDARQRAGL